MGAFEVGDREGDRGVFTAGKARVFELKALSVGAGLDPQPPPGHEQRRQQAEEGKDGEDEHPGGTHIVVDGGGIA